MSDLAKNYDAIWLEPVCKTYERSWCNHDEGPCEDCGLPWIKYVRADLRAPAQVAERKMPDDWCGELPNWIPEKIELPPITELGVAGQVMEAAWPEFGGDQAGADFWYAFNAAVEFTLRASTPAPSPMVTEEEIARVIFDSAVGLTHWDNGFYLGERLGCFDTARKILALLKSKTKERT